MGSAIPKCPKWSAKLSGASCRPDGVLTPTEVTMMKQILSAMVLTVPICAAVPQMASAQRLNSSDFISSDETKQAKEYKLNVEGLGTVTVLSAYATDAPGRTCLRRTQCQTVHLAAGGQVGAARSSLDRSPLLITHKED